ncbi:hypothetical protein IAI19_11825, partial [Streptococcus pseudopneumoniae]|uniref:hypothetical protein n=1 Tax=Streptococcus pseudopneumoniae TaxID=257758 RepID=UPI0018B09962
GVTNTSLATNGRVPTLQDLVEADGRLDDANIPEGGSRGWAFAPKIKRVFTGMTDAVGQPILRKSWGTDEGKEILGMP